jgi:hypothetical protein
MSTDWQPPEPEPEIDPERGLPPHSLVPRKPRTVGGIVYLCVLAVAATGIVLATIGLWRTGLTLVGGVVMAAGVARWIIPDVNAGMLRLRRKAIDVPTMLLIGGALVIMVNTLRGGPLE